jgi:hypothetical protein
MRSVRRQAIWIEGVTSVLVFLAIWLPRTLALDRFVTADEPKWLARSGNFYLALSKRDWAGTFTREHPGVTITWLGMLGYLWRYPHYIEEAPGRLTDASQIELVLRQHGRQPMELLWAGRVLIALAVSIVLLAAFWGVSRLVGRKSALVGMGLMAFDPFFLGLSRLFHLDGLLSSLMFLSIILFLNYLEDESRHRKTLVLSGVVAGLAWLTKSPAFFLLPFVVLLTTTVLVVRWRHEGKLPRFEFKRSLETVGLWCLVAGVVFVALFPAMWVNPLGVLSRIFAEAETYAAEGHSTVVFFHGVITLGDPGRRFYWVNYLWRTTPLVLLGLLLVLPGFLPKLRGWMTKEEHRLSATLLLFAALFAILITLGAKKFDRYMLPLFPALDLVAALGWVAAARWLWGRRLALWRHFGCALVGLVVVLQSVLALSTFPYYLSYYNPWMGGAQKAPQTMMIGWGEGLDQAARYLNQMPNASNLRVLSWYPDGCFSYIFQGHTLGTPPEWEETRALIGEVDYAVLYINQWQRRLPFPEMLRYFEKQRPEQVVVINGIEYAQVYNLKGASPPP